MVSSQMAIFWLVLGLCLTVGISVVPDKTILKPNSDYGPPDQTVYEPRRRHGVPDKTIIRHKGHHGAPKESPNTPNENHGAPTGVPVAPKGNHGAPRGAHVPPTRSHNAPSAAHVAPKVPPSMPRGPSASPIQKQIRAFFVFGDSLVDNGNNDYLYTVARADMPPYGIDSPSHRPTGRFSNGLNIPDVISEYIGSEPLLPYLDPELRDQKLLYGANFASAGVGILNDTGFQFVNVLRVPLQLEYYKEYQQRLGRVVGQKEAQRVINKGLVLVSLGGNDFVNNYYLFPGSAWSQTTTISNFVSHLVAEYRKILEQLYDLGSRRVLVMGSGPLGCAPAARALTLTGDCDADLQAAAALFEPQVTKMVQELNAKYHDDVFIAANTKLMHHDILSDPKSFGFVTSKEACCGSGPLNALPASCSMVSNLCPNRDEYVFWDAYHPTERANRIFVDQMMRGSNDYMSPMNLSVILSIDS